jgi:hypothetical protein
LAAANAGNKPNAIANSHAAARRRLPVVEPASATKWRAEINGPFSLPTARLALIFVNIIGYSMDILSLAGPFESIAIGGRLV